ncbi:uncharacterized protein [Amphiura filiformis]|uniref:uncharacterized protein n=1 Tax=Amphiura filiformis TaxID=82378 RepID=UPI003B218821
MVRYFTWKDAVVVSNVQGIIDPPTGVLLSSFPITGKLRAGQSYHAVRTVIVPDSLKGGSFFVYVIPDYFQVLTSSSTDLQSRPLFEVNAPIDIPERARPDLTADYRGGEVALEVSAGQSISINFLGRNIGGPTPINSWIDAVYIDSYTEADAPSLSALLVQQVHHIGSVEYNEQYETQTEFQVPYSVSGTFALYIQLDYLQSVDESNEENNFIKLPSPITVVAAPLPDLIVSTQDTLSVRSGEPFILKMNVTNIGEAPLNQTLFSVIYLSEDVDISPFDTKILNTELTLYLDINSTESVELDIFMPFDIPTAVYYVIVHIDSRNDVYEINNENNIAYAVATISESFSTDVAVISVTPPPSPVMVNADITVQWTLRNNGSEDAIGYKCDTTYFSEDNMWSIDDEEIGTRCNLVNLRPFNNDARNDMSYSLTSTVPLITPKGYRTIVRSRSNIRDLNLANNVGAAQSETDVDIDILNLDDPIDVMLSLNEVKVFRVPNVIAEETLIFRMTSDTETDFSELYVRHGEIASTGEYDAAGLEFLAPNQNAAIAKSRAGDYFVLIRKRGTSLSSEPSSYQSTITLLVKYARLEILEVTPRQAAPFGTVTLRILGTLFPEESKVSLLDEDMVALDAQEVFHFTSLEIYATFDISNQQVSSKLSLRISDSYSNAIETVFTDALTIIDGRPGALSFRFDNPGRLLPSETGRIHLFLQNVGESDILTPMLRLDLDGDATFQIIGDSQTSNWTTSHTIYGVPQQGPGGILPPGQNSRVTFDIRPNSFVTSRVRFRVTELPPYANLDNPYKEKGHLFKPYEIDKSSWQRVWSNFVKFTGSSQASLSAQLAKTANQLSLIGRRLFDMNEMIQLQVKLADGFQAGNVLYSKTDLTFGSQDPGLHSAEIVRSFSPRLGHRNYVGSFGRGWSTPYLSTKLRKVTIGYAVLERGPETLVFPVSSFNRFELPFIGQIEVQESEIIFIDAVLSAKTNYHFDKSTYRLTRITNEFDRTALAFSYDNSTSLLETVTSSHGFHLTFEYNSQKLIDVVSLNGEEAEPTVARYTYDNEYQYLTSVEVDDTVVHYTYTSDGALESVGDSDGVRQEYMYDADGLYAGSATFDKSTGQLDKRITFEHDSSGKTVSFEEPTNDTTVYIFDEMANLGYVKTLGTLSYRFIRNYRDGSKTTFVGDQLLSEEKYDVTTDTLMVLDANGATNALGLQPNGDVNYIKDGEGNVRTAAYQNDLLINVTFPDGSKEEYFYDDNGSLTGFKTRNGDTLSYESDENGNIVKKEVPDEPPTYYLYDHRGFVVEATNGIGKILIDYTVSGLPFMVQYPNGRILTYEYDDQSRRTGLHDNMGYNITYVYDNNGQLVDVIDNSKAIKVLEVDFDSLGRVSRRGTGNGCSTDYEYDARGKKIKSLKTSCLDSGNSASILEVEYGFDSRNRVKEMNSTSGNWRYRYDATSQVTGWIDPRGKETSITYDNAKNRRVLSEGSTDTAYTVNNLTQYENFGNDIEFEHDMNGNLVEILDQAQGDVDRFVYSVDSQLVGIASSEEDCSLTYDALGNLYQKTCSGKTTTYLVDPFGYFGSDVLAELQDDDEVYYIHASYHGLIAMVPSNNTGVYYYHFDALGSVLSLVDDQQMVLNTYQYDPFGNVIASEESIPNSYQFIGQWGVRKVKESPGLYYMRARFYNSQHGRFLTLDPYGIGGKSTNLYCYGNNNPLENIDPKGTAIPWVVAGIVGAVANTGVYVVGELLSGNTPTLAGTAGAAVGGAISGALALTPIGPVGGSAVGAAIGNIVGSVVKGEDVDVGQLIQETLVGGATAGIPIKPFLYGSSDALLDAITEKTLRQNLLGKPGLSMVLNGGLGSAISTTVNKLFDAIEAGVEHALPIIADAFKNGIDYANERLDDFKDIANDLIQDAGDFADQIGDSLSDAVDQVTDRVGQEIDNIANEVSEAATDISNTVNEAFDNIQDTIGEATDSIGNSLQEGFQDISDSLGDASTDIKDTLQNTLDDLSNSATEGYNDIKDSVTDAYDDISDSLGSGASDIGDIINDAVGDVLDANSFDEATSAIGDAIQDISETIDNTIDSVTDTAGNAINDIKDSIGETVNDFGESIGDAASDIKETVSDTIDDVSDIVSETWDDIKDTASDAFDDITDTASDAIDDVTDTIGETIDDISEGVSDAIDDIGDIVDDTLDDIGDALDDITDDIGDAIDDLGDLWDDITDDIADGASNLVEDLLDWPRSRDPNDIIGPSGYGDARFMPVDAVLSYRIRFENDVNATAPAQRVFVITTLDADLDIRTLRVGSYGFGNFTQEVANPSGFLQGNLDLVDTLGVYVRVRAGLNIISQEVTWELLTIDPETGQQPTDPSIGFLPPNPENGTEGQGYVTFSVKPKRDTPDLAVIDAEARIIFDQNDPIDTPPIFNTIDSGVPSVNITIVEETLPSGIFAVRLQKNDVASGVKSVDILVDKDTGNEIIKDGIIDSVVTLDLTMGMSYKLIAIPTDNVGNAPPIAALLSHSVVEAFFPEIEFSCEMVNNCSGYGACIGDNLCDCLPGWYGDACQSDIPPVEPPIVAFQATESSEDSSISIAITVRTADTNPNSTTVVVVRNVPPEASLNYGDKVGEDWHVPLESLPDLALIPPPNFDGTITLLFIATTTGPRGDATREISLPLALQAVADPVNLDIEPACYTPDQTRVSLNVVVTTTDIDGSENVTLLISGVPENVTLIPGNRLTNGQYLVLSEDLPLLELVSSTAPFPLLRLSVTVRSTEITNGDIWEDAVEIQIGECATTTDRPVTPGKSDYTTLAIVIAVCCIHHHYRNHLHNMVLCMSKN